MHLLHQFLTIVLPVTSYGYVGGDDEDFDLGGDERDELGVPLFEVTLCSGETVKVQTEVEARWFTDTKGKYLTENKFTETSDLQDVDRLLVLELAVFRWTQHLASGYDYHGGLVDEDLLRKSIKDQSAIIISLKQSLSLDKKSREQALNEGNFHSWITDVKRRAKIFGIHRENQLNVALSLMNELAGIVGAYDRSDAEERKKLGYETEGDILTWIRESMIPDFKQVDEHFIENEQKLWKRDM